MSSYQSPRTDADQDPLHEVAGSACENDPAHRIDTFADHVDRVLWSVGVLGLPCTWMPIEYGGSTFAHTKRS